MPMAIRSQRSLLTLVIGSFAMAPSSAAPLTGPEAAPSDFAARCKVVGFVARDVAIRFAKLETNAVAGALCHVEGRVVTRGGDAAPGSAAFALNLPAHWNGKLLFQGGGGFDGMIPPADMQQIARGYATLSTDSGHVGNPAALIPPLDTSWALDASGKPDRPKLADYFYRARHQVNRNVRPLISRFYGQAVNRAYFMGCSGGGREALIEAQRNPQDYDGFIAGDPMTDPMRGVSSIATVRSLLQTPIPFSRFPAIDAEVIAQCDTVDGTRDGLVQNPAACSFDSQALVKKGVLTDKEADAFSAYISALRDENGAFLTYGQPLTGLGTSGNPVPNVPSAMGISASMTDPSPPLRQGQPWGTLMKGPLSWIVGYGSVADILFQKRGMDVLGPDVIAANGRVTASAARLSRERWAPAVVDSRKMRTFFARDRKLLIYHGYSDHVLNPYGSIHIYDGIMKTGGGAAKAGRNVRLFMVPDMQHCYGGSGPNSFDLLPVLERWVEQGQAPDHILATKFTDDDPSKPVQRTMPVCAFPAMVRYRGQGALNDAANWSCPPGGQGLRQIGKSGKDAGITPPS